MKQGLKRQQRGATLIVCLIILVVITFMGVSSIQDTTMEEKMAGNMKNRNMAFQGAESALRAGEVYLDSTPILPNFNGSGGLFSQFDGTNTPPNQWNATQWGASAAAFSVYSSANLDQLASEPLVVIEKLDALTPEPSKEAGQAKDSDDYYRVTARAVGGTSTSVVILQSIYRR